MLALEVAEFYTLPTINRLYKFSVCLHDIIGMPAVYVNGQNGRSCKLQREREKQLSMY